jgi:hypothetical protein
VRHRVVSILASIPALGGLGALVLGACSADRSSFDPRPPPLVTPDSGAEDASSACGFRCSRDLKKVLHHCGDEEDRVVAECQTGQGCGIDSCVNACESAALSKGSTGCSFWTLPPDDFAYAAGCFAAMVANTWDVPVNITADYGDEPLDISSSIYSASRDGTNEPVHALRRGPLLPGEVAIVFLSDASARGGAFPVPCPQGVTAALTFDPIRHGTLKTRAFHLKTDAPVAAYSIFPYGGAKSYVPTATLLLPVSSWDKSYVAVSPAKFGLATDPTMDRRTLQIVANEDDTKVAMRPTADIAQGEDVPPAAADEITEWTLSRGQVLQITQERSASGSPFSANKPVGLFGGSPCAFIPSDTSYCDLTQQQIAPFAQWGTEYALVPYLSRLIAVEGTTRENVAWSLVGAVNGTELVYDPAKPPAAPETLAAGQVASFMTDALVTVKSQDSGHPFHASVHMTGSMASGGIRGGMSSTLGDPDFVNIVPSDQFLDRYIFFADFTYPETSLTIVRRKTSGGFMPVKLACGGEISGFAPLGTRGEYEYAWVKLTSGYAPLASVCGGYGRHEATSDGPFSITVWGWGKDASYGYAGGTGSRPINEARLPVVN